MKSQECDPVAWSQLRQPANLNLQWAASLNELAAFFFCKQVASCVTPIMRGRSIAALPPVSPSWGDSVLGRQRVGEEKGMNVKPPTQWRRLLPFFSHLELPPTLSASRAAAPCRGWRGLVVVDLHMRRQPGRSFTLLIIFWRNLICVLAVHCCDVVRSIQFWITSLVLQGCCIFWKWFLVLVVWIKLHSNLPIVCQVDIVPALADRASPVTLSRLFVTCSNWALRGSAEPLSAGLSRVLPASTTLSSH